MNNPNELNEPIKDPEPAPELGPDKPKPEFEPEPWPYKPEPEPEPEPEPTSTPVVEPSNGEDTRTPEEQNAIKEKILQNKLKYQNEQKILMIKKKIDSDGGATSGNTQGSGPVAPPSDDTDSLKKNTEDYGWGGNDPDAPYEDSHFTSIDSLYKDDVAENAQLANNIALKNLRNMSK